MHMHFENEKGRVDFGFGSGEINIITLDGFGIVTPEYSTVSYVEYDGDYTMSRRCGARTMTVSGDICGSNLKISKIFSILCEPGYLHIGFGQKRRKIFCSRVSISDGSRYGRYMRFVIQFTADMPYFEAETPTKGDVYYITKLLGGEFHFPTKLGNFVSSTVIENMGDKKCEPVFYIINNGFYPTDSGGFGIKILNKTTNQQIELLTSTVEGEIITLDIEKRSITSNIRGNLLFCISQDTYLNDFWLDCGSNAISVINNNTNEKIIVSVEFARKFGDAIY